MPLCTNFTINSASSIIDNPQGNGNRIIEAAKKYVGKWVTNTEIVAEKTSDKDLYWCNALICYVLRDCGLKDSSYWSNAKGNGHMLEQDNRFVEIKYVQGEAARAGDIVWIDRKGRKSSDHNMICWSTDANGRVKEYLSEGISSDTQGKNHVDLRGSNTFREGTADYNDLRFFRLIGG